MTQPRKSYTVDELKAEGAIQLALRASEQPPGGYVPSKPRACSKCGEQVRISDGAFPLADQIPIVCTRCFENEQLLGNVRP